MHIRSSFVLGLLGNSLIRLEKLVPKDVCRAMQVAGTAPMATSASAPDRLTPPDWRSTSLFAGAVCLWMILVVRLIQLQGFTRAALAAQAHRQQTRSEILAARPGDILDRRGRLLATTVETPSLFVNPSRIDDTEQFTDQISRALELDREQLLSRLKKYRDKQFLWIKRRLSIQELEAVEALKFSREIAGYRLEFRRHYPQGHYAAHVLGLRTLENVGRGGIEQSQDSRLQGRDGVRRFVRDARGRVLDVLEEVTEPPVAGCSITLTLDVVIQQIVEERLDQLCSNEHPLGACAIVMEPHSGEILAMASRPAFEPDAPIDVAEEAWKNLAISAVFEPGSTFKPLVVARALDLQRIDRDQMIDCEWGSYRMGRRVLHDHHRYGLLSLTDVLVQSSNIGMAKIGEALGNAELFRACQDFGFGRTTGIELVGELPGILHPLEHWTSYSTGSIPMGQELAATPLQIITAHAVLANGGQRIVPKVILRADAKQQAVTWIDRGELIHERTARWLVTGPLADIVRRGTGTKAQLQEYTVFGKTGTAQKAHEDKRGYSNSRHVSSFVCGAPAENPAAMVLVMLDEPSSQASQFGGIVAAPTAAAILNETLKYLRIPATSTVTSSSGAQSQQE